MALSDFDQLTPGEFRSIYKAWASHEERRTATLLAAVRAHAAIVIAPHVKQVPSPSELIYIPLIDDHRKNNRPKLTKEERQARLKELKKQRGYV